MESSATDGTQCPLLEFRGSGIQLKKKKLNFVIAGARGSTLETCLFVECHQVVVEV